MKSAEVEIGPVHHIEGTGLDRQGVEDFDVVGLAVGNPHETRDIPAEVEERVQLDGTLAATESRPREERQAEVDGGGIQRVGGLLELSTEAIGLVQPPRAGDQDLGEIRVDPPVAVLVGIGERTPCDRPAKARVVELLVEGAEAGLDIAQALAVGQLSEGHAQELIETGEVADPSIAVIARDATVELAPG